MTGSYTTRGERGATPVIGRFGPLEPVGGDPAWLPAPRHGATARLESLLELGDETARKRLLEGHLELGALLARRLAPTWMRPIDAIQEANVVLARLVDDKSVALPVRELTSALIRHYDGIERRTS